MRSWWGWAAAVLGATVVTAGCANPLGPKYEYEEQVYLRVDGSATVLIDASIAAFVALRNLPIDESARASIDREQVRRIFTAAGCRSVSVGQPWMRQGRRFVQVQVDAANVAELSSCGPLRWSTYTFEREADTIRYQQIVGAPDAGNPGTIGWDGTELVAFKLHLPSRIVYHNVKKLEDGTNGAPSRGNILTWEQRLSDRRAGQPVNMEIRMGSQSILFRTLWLFAAAFAGALTVLAALIWWTIRRAKHRPGPAARPPHAAS